MAPRKKLRQREAQLAFEALSIEGGLISPEWLAKVAQLEAGGQGEPDYRILKGLALRDEIGRFWRVAQAHWGDFERSWKAGTADRVVTDRFVTTLLRDAFGFASLSSTPTVVKGERTYPLGWTALDGRVPVVIVAPHAPSPDEKGRRPALEEALPEFGDGTLRRSAFGLAQEYLNAEDDALWAITCDGVTLRICRDNASLTRPAWIEADLGRIFAEERYADFAALWLLAHETRFGAAGQPVTACHLETWRNAGKEEGTRAQDELRDGVEEALKILGRGFLVHPENQPLRAALAAGLGRDAFFQELLRLVYRIIFLLTAEERELLHPEGTADAVKARYREGYSMRRLRDRAARRSAHDRFGDLWEGLKITVRGAGAGEDRLGLPALGGLFAASQCPHLDAARLENRWFLTAIFRLAWLKGDSGLVRVNWRDMGPEELGSVYESLLELVPVIPADFRGFDFATGGEAKGNARKTTGSYYTPDSLVQVLLDSALEPVVKEAIARNPSDPVEAVLQLTVVDPACGSGHFLLSAARRMAVHVARLRAKGTPSAAEYRTALRQVVGRCLFGVDLNPMAVELCRVALWMEAMEPGRPLSFLDSHVQRGNALLGTMPELMKGGIPDAAFEAIEGDEKKTASLLKKRNKAAAAGQRSFDLAAPAAGEAEAAAVTAGAKAVEAQADADLAAVAAKQGRWNELLGSSAYRHQKLVADAWCAAFVWPKPKVEEKKSNPLVDAAPTNDVWRALRDGQGKPAELTVKTVEDLAEQYHFFHWHLAFPQVFERGGFDVVLGNPPWEQVELKEEEWFAERSPNIAGAPNAAARKRLIEQLAKEDPQLFASFHLAVRAYEGETHLMRSGGRFPLCAKGRINTYAIFAEHNRNVLGARGRAGFIVPTGIATDDTTKDYFASLVARRELARFYSFENEEFVFPGVHHAFKFALLSLDRGGDSAFADLVFFARQVAALADGSRHFSLTPADFEALNPNTRTCPTFRSRRDADISLDMYRRVGILWRESDEEYGNRWGLRFTQGLFNMASDSSLFRTRAELEDAGGRLDGSRFVGRPGEHLPLIEAKMVHHFDHRFGTYEGQTEAQGNQGKLPELDTSAHADPLRLTLPHYWVPEREVADRLLPSSPEWLMGWRRICRSTDQRTFISSLFPLAGVGDSEFLLLSSAESRARACLYGCLSSLVLDYAARQKIGGTNASFHIVRQLPVLKPDAYANETAWHRGTSLSDWLVPGVLELTYTAWDLEPFAKDVGYDGPPFRWDPARRFLLRGELDAAFFHLYGISRDDTDYIMETFPVVRKNDEKAHGEYRTKRVILEIYDAMAEAIRTGQPYQTRLDPPPADPRVAHPPRRGAN